jgi:hypothetical protein
MLKESIDRVEQEIGRYHFRRNTRNEKRSVNIISTNA